MRRLQRNPGCRLRLELHAQAKFIGQSLNSPKLIRFAHLDGLRQRRIGAGSLWNGACLIARGMIPAEETLKRAWVAGVQAHLHALQRMDWHEPDGPMRLSGRVPMADLDGSVFFVNLRRLLQVLAEEDGADATATGNLTRAFVGRMFEQMELPGTFRESTRRVCKVLNEQDVWALHVARIVAECAGLMRRRGKRFALTAEGRKLLPDGQAGALFREVFIAYFRRFDLTYDFDLRPVPAIQQTMASVLWRLDSAARDWVPVRGLAREILLPKVHDLLRAAMTHPAHDTEEWILGGHVLEPLVDLGLIEREQPGEWRMFEGGEKIRITRLWRQFIWFEWQF